MKAALDARSDPSLVIIAHRSAAVTSVDDAIIRAKAYQATGVDALFFTGVKTRATRAISAARRAVVLGGRPRR